MGEAGLHLGAERRLDDQLAAARVVQLDAAGVQLQLQHAGQFARLLVAVLGVAQDRVADGGHVGAQLVRAAGEGA
ncbi:hypothetical protein D3C85_1370490 [compost metagenome]